MRYARSMNKVRTTDTLAGVALGMAISLSCGGIRETVELLRAERIEIVDASSNVQLDVGAELRNLQSRIVELEKVRGK